MTWFRETLVPAARWMARMFKSVAAYAWARLKDIRAFWRSLSLNVLTMFAALIALIAGVLAAYSGQATELDIARIREWLVLARPFAPYATAAVAFLASIVALLGIAQRHNADRRAEWWRRAQYGLDALRDVDKAGRVAGMELLKSLLDDQRWHKVDVSTLQSVIAVLIEEVLFELETSELGGDPDAESDPNRSTSG